MKWEKMGRLLVLDELENRLLYAQSPQVIVLKDFIRIYFSTRINDHGKYISHISYVDMDKQLKAILGLSTHTVVSLGEIGCFDEHGIFPINVLPIGDTIHGYITGWSRRQSVSVDTAIGLVISKDGGNTFQRIGNGPIFSSSIYEPFLIADAFVKQYHGLFHMWYIFGTSWDIYEGEKEPDRIYKIGHAISIDGINWKREGRRIINDKIEHECQALPSVIEIGGQYHMYFCYRYASDFRKNPTRAYRLGYAYSDDLVNWVRDDEHAGIDVTPGEWDSDMMCYPHIFEVDGNIYLLYNGNEFGKYGFGAAKLII